MKDSLVSSSKGQMKVQQMAFVLVAIVIFFVLVGMLFLVLQVSSLKNSAENLRDVESIENVKKIASAPEFSWTIDECESCVDLDKIFLLKERQSYKEFWDFSLLRIEKIYPSGEGECTRNNYPNCGKITIIEKNQIFNAKSSFVSLCRYEPSEKYYKCELGKIVLAGEDLA